MSQEEMSVFGSEVFCLEVLCVVHFGLYVGGSSFHGIGSFDDGHIVDVGSDGEEHD